MTKDNNPYHFDLNALNQSIQYAAEKFHPLLRQFLKKHSIDSLKKAPIDPFNMRDSWAEYAAHLSKNPQKFIDMQINFWDGWLNLWNNSVERFVDNQNTPPLYTPQPSDKRFKDDIWSQNPWFDFIKQSYLLISQSLSDSIDQIDNLDLHDKKKLGFFVRQYVDSIAPSNFIFTNPKIIQTTIESGGENLVTGLKNLLDDIERGGGELKISTTDYNAFQLGNNIASTPGKVVFENHLFQLIHYQASGETTYKQPLLIIPPWINKYYILDLRPDNSLVKWMLDQGHDVFIMSWVNPDTALADINFEDYLIDGAHRALTAVLDITGQKQANMVGYCMGGTLLMCLLAWLEKSKDQTNNQTNDKADKVASATFLTTLVDFQDAGDLTVFIDEKQIEMIELQMAQKGYLDAAILRSTFSMLRSSDLIWSFVVNNYLLGKAPFPFDLLYWNDDATNLTATSHSYYLRQMYLQNNLIKPNGLHMAGQDLDISQIKTPCYFLSTQDDHIAPWKSTYKTLQHIATPKTPQTCRFVLSTSGHIAGVINPPAAQKYAYYTSDNISQKTGYPSDPEQWMASTTKHDFSWWDDWQKWITQYTGDKTPARTPGTHKDYPATQNAPGSYVTKKAL